MAHVTLFTTPTCGYCKMAKAFFKEHNVEYTEHDVATDQKAAEEMVAKSHQTSVPVIDIDGTIVTGFDKEKLSSLLHINE